MNRSRVLAERTADLAQRLPRFPSLPQVRFLGAADKPERPICPMTIILQLHRIPDGVALIA